MFKPTDAKTPSEYIAKIQDDARRADVAQLDKLIRKTVPKLKPWILYGMIGYGKYRYKPRSGAEGDWSSIALASQKQYISLYVSCTDDGKYIAEKYKKDLPKANIGKSCIRFRKLSDIDLKVIEKVLREAERLGGMGAV